MRKTILLIIMFLLIAVNVYAAFGGGNFGLDNFGYQTFGFGEYGENAVPPTPREQEQVVFAGENVVFAGENVIY